jgi:hypothetical protein
VPTLKSAAVRPTVAKIWPLINCPPVPPKRPFSEHAKIDFDINNASRFLRKKILFRSVTGRLVNYNVLRNAHHTPNGYASNAHNEFYALRARVLSEKLPNVELGDDPQRGADSADIKSVKESPLHKFIHANFREFFPDMYNIQPVPFDEYIRRVGSSPSVKAKIIKAHKELDAAGIKPWTKLTNQQLASWTTRSSFVKVEMNMYDGPFGLFPKAPRLIQGATPHFVALVGPWIMAVQDLMQRRWAPKKHPFCFTSGVSNTQAAAHVMQNENMKLFFDDIGSFDLDQGRAWGHEMVMISKKLGAPRAVLQLLKANIDTHGFTHHGFKYSCRGTRKSGDPYTSLFNTIINLLCHAYVFCKQTLLPWKEGKRLLIMVGQGDDNAGAHSPKYTIDWRKGMKECGFDSEATYAHRLHDMEFCSSVLVKLQRGYVFVPLLGRTLTKLGYCINLPPQITPRDFIVGKMRSLYNSVYPIPCLRNLFDATFNTLGLESSYRPKKEEHWMRSGDPAVYTSPDSFGSVALMLLERYRLSPLNSRELVDDYCEDASTIRERVDLLTLDRDAVGTPFIPRV